MTQKQERERRTVDGKLAARIGVFNAVGFILSVVSPMIIDSRLTTNVQFGARHYAHWKYALTLGAVPIFWFTRKLLTDSKVSRLNYVYAFFLLFIPSLIIAFTTFYPEIPHKGTILISLAYASASMLTVASRQSREDFGYLNNGELEFHARLERLKATVSTWQYISVYGLAAYIGFVAVALGTLWTVGGAIVTVDAERVFLLQTNIAHLSIYSFCVGFGPLHESFEMMFHSVRQLSAIKQNPEQNN